MIDPTMTDPTMTDPTHPPAVSDAPVPAPAPALSPVGPIPPAAAAAPAPLAPAAGLAYPMPNAFIMGMLHTVCANIEAFFRHVLSKGLAYIILGLAMWGYASLPQTCAFAELLYTAILIFGTITVAGLARLLFFPEVARYAEGAGMAEALRTGKFSPELVHYWIATAISFLVTLACLATLHH